MSSTDRNAGLMAYLWAPIVAGVTFHEVCTYVTAALGFCVILLILTFIFAEVIHLAKLAPPMETVLAFAPGGQAELTVLALIVGADMAFVVAHRVLRIFVVILGAPLIAKLTGNGQNTPWR